LTAATNVVGEAVRTLHRVIIERVSPEVDAGRFAIKRIVGDELRVRADIYADGHDSLGARLLWRREEERSWNEAPMRLDNNDRWEGRFKLEKLGRYLYTIVAWMDAFGSWGKDLKKRADAGQDIAVDVLIGAEIVREASERARGAEAKKLADAAAKLKELAKKDRGGALAISQDAELALLVNAWRDRTADTRYERELAVVVDPEKARFSTWYELFPRSVTSDPKRHGTFKDVIDRLPYVAGMGFDILYMPPGGRSAKGKTTRRRRVQTIRVVRGRLEPKRADTRRFIRNSARWTNLRRWWRKRANSASISRWISHSNARRIILM